MEVFQPSVALTVANTSSTQQFQTFQQGEEIKSSGSFLESFKIYCIHRLSVVVDNQVAYNRKWKIRITQHSCESPEAAPEGCLQYLTGISGRVSNGTKGLILNQLCIFYIVSNWL